ncbi:putative Zinc metalloproteinase nas-14 [Hypsibius exemplaris]|uniref:Metalloendopeptidase n=1 Tax=Hypsibius exemplaris TaxID=2072580 RepID=A0A1W0WQC1_HYPEX|nr:putative Zinc metalloproteinase nas-14 [Hypsibius exemplaris]
MWITVFGTVCFAYIVGGASLFPPRPAIITETNSNINKADTPPSYDGRMEDPVVMPSLFEGDIAGLIEAKDTEKDIVDKLNRRATKSGVLSPSSRWHGGKVYYQLSTSLSASERNMILAAFQEFEITDAVRFYERASNTSDYILIKSNEAGCWATIGRVGGEQYVNLGFGCWLHGIIVHELGHAIGFYHEQARTDRDDYVEINLDNVGAGSAHNFWKYDASQITKSGTSYDFDSVMHYSQTEFAVDTSSWTVRPKAPNQNRPIGQRIRLSITDIREINSLYQLCGTLYEDDGGIGPSLRVLNGMDHTFASHQFNTFSSAWVKKDCKMTMYSLAEFQGPSYWIKASNYQDSYFSFVGQSHDNFARSIKCVCE